MKKYKIKSPNGKEYNVNAISIYSAIQKIVEIEDYNFSNIDYLKINKYDKNKINRTRVY